MRWTVTGLEAAAGVAGFPKEAVTTADANGVATFRFIPSKNSALVSNRRTKWTLGSRTANPAIAFDVTASVIAGGTTYTSKLSETSLGPLRQDETDRLRQEYYDYNIPVPARSDVVTSLGTGFNQGNYGVQLSVGLRTRFDAILSAYRGRQVSVVIDKKTYTARIPLNASVTISSGFRNPQRNKAVSKGKFYPDSKHTRGRALDLQPGAVTVVVKVNGKDRTVTLPLHDTLYRALWSAAATQGNPPPIAEYDTAEVPLGDARENHIHVQW